MARTQFTSRITPNSGDVSASPLTMQCGRREGGNGGGTVAHGTRTFRTAGTFSDLALTVRSNVANGAIVHTVMRNGAATGIAISVGAGLIGQFHDPDSQAFSAGDTGYIEVDATADTAGTPGILGERSIGFDASGETVVVLMAVGDFRNTGDSTRFVAPIDMADWAATESQHQQRMDLDGTIRNFQTYVETNSRVNTTVHSPRIAGASSTNLVISVGAGLIGEFEDLTGSDAVSSGQMLGFRQTTGSGTQVIGSSQVSVEWVSDVEGEYPILRDTWIGTFHELPAGTTQYSFIGGLTTEWGTAESGFRFDMLFGTQLDRLSGYAIANGVLAASSVNLRKNGTTPGPSLTFPASTAGWQTDLTSPPVTYAATDEHSYQYVIGAGGTVLGLIRMAVVARAVAVEGPKLRIVQSGLRAA